MCGRYEFSAWGTDDKLSVLIDAMERRFPGGYKTGEIFPGDRAPAIIGAGERLVPVPAVFGFPGFQEGKLLINARSETVEKKPAFSGFFRERRIILPATGFYEWGRDSKKTKYLFTVDERPAVYLCGVYRILEGELRFVILTRAANESMAESHDRMPVIAAEGEVRSYLLDLDFARRLTQGPATLLRRKPAS